jgi:hypothetical protein
LRPARLEALADAAAPASTPRKPASAHAAMLLASAEARVLPAAPDFTAATHKRFRPKLTR